MANAIASNDFFLKAGISADVIDKCHSIRDKKQAKKLEIDFSSLKVFAVLLLVCESFLPSQLNVVIGQSPNIEQREIIGRWSSQRDKTPGLLPLTVNLLGTGTHQILHPGGSA